MIETTSSASIPACDPHVLSFDLSLEGATSPGAGVEASPASPRPCPPAAAGHPQHGLEHGLDEESLSLRDISVLDPLSSRHAGVRRSWHEEPPSAPIADPLIGVTVADRYRIVAPLGRGGMGIVYKVKHARLGKLLAMKLLKGELSQNPEVMRRFKREALTVSKLESPNTVQVFDFGASDGLTYLVMELVHGENLGHILRVQGPMPFSRLGKIVIQICSSLAEAHQKGIVHRDIKPENVVIVSASDGTDVAKVLDFGLAKLREAEGLNEITSHDTIVGTPYYMAPEQIRCDEVDSRADIYGVGALMYRLMTGHYVFAGTPMAVLSKHLYEAPIPPAERAPELGIPPGMSRLVMRALSKDPGNRFQRIEELQALLLEEIRAAGSSSVEGLLDPGRLRRIAREAEPAHGDVGSAIATRDEVDAYERKLRCKRYGAAGMAAALLATAGIGASFLVHQDTKFSGLEAEPNNTAADATVLPLGQTMTGYLGKRIDASHGDRDLYALDLPASAPGAPSHLRLRVSALPNLAMCAMLYKPGFADALGQYCVGRPGRDLVIPDLQLGAGRYFIAVIQDLDGYGGVPPHVHENISDPYTILAESTTLEPGAESEPNDQVASATRLGLSLPRSAAIGWSRDEDVFCIPEDVSGRIRWTVRTGFRESGVLEATPMHGGEEGAPVRIHRDENGKLSNADAVSPWESAPILADGASQRCLRVRLTTDPWSPDRMTGVPHGGSEPYVVQADAIP